MKQYCLLNFQWNRLICNSHTHAHTPISNGQLLVWVCLEVKVSKHGPFHADYWLHVPISPFSVKPNIKILYPLFLPPIWVAGLNGKWSDNFSRALWFCIFIAIKLMVNHRSCVTLGSKYWHVLTFQSKHGAFFQNLLLKEILLFCYLTKHEYEDKRYHLS